MPHKPAQPVLILHLTVNGTPRPGFEGLQDPTANGERVEPSPKGVRIRAPEQCEHHTTTVNGILVESGIGPVEVHITSEHSVGDGISRAIGTAELRISGKL